MADTPPKINPGDPIRAPWLNNVADLARGQPMMHGIGYFTTGLGAFVAGRRGRRGEEKPDTEFFAKTTIALPEGLLPPSTKVAENKGEAWNSGAGEPTGREIEVHVSAVAIPADSWVLCKRINGYVYVAPWRCPEPEPEEPPE